MNNETYSLHYPLFDGGTGSMLFTNANDANYWKNEFVRAGANHLVIRKLCKRHAARASSAHYGKCCKIVFDSDKDG